MLSTVGNTSDTGRHVVFGPACYAHAVGTTDLFQSVRIGGINSEDQLEAFVFDGARLDLVSDCDGINCEASCPQVELSPEATVCIARKGEKGQLSYYISALIGMIYNTFDMS